MKFHILALGWMTCPRIAATIDKANVAVTSRDIFVLLDKSENIFTGYLNRCLAESGREARLRYHYLRIETGRCCAGVLGLTFCPAWDVSGVTNNSHSNFRNSEQADRVVPRGRWKLAGLRRVGFRGRDGALRRPRMYLPGEWPFADAAARRPYHRMPPQAG